MSHFPCKDAILQLPRPQHLHFAPLCPPHPTPASTALYTVQQMANSTHITWEPVRNQKPGPTRVLWSRNLQFSRTPGDSQACYSLRATLKNQRRRVARRLRLP